MDFPNYVEDDPPPFFKDPNGFSINKTTASPSTMTFDLFATGTGSDVASTGSTILASFLNTTINSIAEIQPTGNDSSNVTSDSLMKYPLFVVGFYINKYYLWVVFAFGFPGNVVSFLTVIHMKPFTSPTMYVAALALVDNTCLTCKLVFLLLTKYDANLGHGGCGILLFLGSFTGEFANWLLVAMTVERCLAICIPLKVGSICTRKLHIAGIVLIATTLTGINVQHFFTIEMKDNNGDYSCTQRAEHADFLQVWTWVDAMFYAIMPAILLLVMNTLLILGIRRSAKIQRELTGKASQAMDAMRQQRQITIMLVIVCVAFVLLITPHALFFAVKRYWVYEENSYEQVKFMFTTQIIFLLSDSTHAVNFYLYFFSNRKFRKRCMETVMFCSSGRRRRFRSLPYSANSSASNAFRMSMTEVTSIPSNHSNIPLRHLSSSSTSSSSSLGRGRHLVVKNGHKDNEAVRKCLVGSGASRGKGDNHKNNGMTKTRFGRFDGSNRHYAAAS